VSARPTYKELEQRIKVLEKAARDAERLQEALRESEQKFRVLVDSTPSSVLLFQDGRFIYANRAAQIHSGYSLEELIGKNFWEFIHPDYRALAMERGFKREQGEETIDTYELKIIAKDGSEKWGELSGATTMIGGRPAAIISVFDVTERRRAEEALRESEAKFRALTDSSPTAIVIYQDGRYIHANRAAQEITGYSLEELLGMSVLDFVHRDYRDEVRELTAKRQQGSTETRRIEIRIIARDGTVKWVDLTGAAAMIGGRPAGIVSVVDITERRRAEEALRESEEKFRILTDSSPTAVVLYQDDRFIYANRASRAVTGYSPEEIVGMHLLDFIHPDYRDEVRQRSTRRQQGEKALYRYEIKIVAKDGTEKWTDLSGGLTMIGGRPAGIVSVIDITKRRQAEEALKESEELYTRLVNTIPDVVVRTDLEGNILFANDRTSRISGYTRDELVGMNIRDFIAPEERGRLFENPYLMMKGRPGPREYLMVGKDGRKIPFEVNGDVLRDAGGQPFGIVNVCRDISERRRAAEMSRQSEEKFHKVFMMSPDCNAITRLSDGLIIDVNAGFGEITGWDVSEAIGQTSFEINFWSDTADRDFMAGEMKAGRDIIQREFQFRKKDGTVRDGVFSARAITISGEACLIFSMQDVTERKRLAEDRRQLQERLKRAEKMEAVGQLAGGVAHDLNNVLGVLAGYSELLMIDMPEGKRSRGYVEKILQSTEKGAAIIQDLLTLARRGVTTSEIVNLNSIVSGFLKTPVFEKIKDYHSNVTFRTDCREALMNIKGSPVHLEKTLMNLVSNAAESISGEGVVTISTRSCYLDMALRGYDEIREGDYTVLTVTDSGMGIPAEIREKIFEPFYTKKIMGRSGTGLGLAIVWGTVKDHNGYIDVESTVGQGTTFTLYFPASREEAAAPDSKQPMTGYMGRGESVLLVDDIAEQREVASVLLKQLGYVVHAAASGEEAVEYLKGHKADIMILDMIMAPGIDGLETYKRALDINPKQKAILVSGFSETDRVRQAHELGAGAYVKKPYLMEKIGMAIREELNRH
jgi:PAS domain S-box-containing protein